jgi:cell division protease FtsH
MVRRPFNPAERWFSPNRIHYPFSGGRSRLCHILLAATNRPEVPDKALLRPGRFDHQVVIDSPNMNGREAILKVHCHGKPLADGVELQKIAQGEAVMLSVSS